MNKGFVHISEIIGKEYLKNFIKRMEKADKCQHEKAIEVQNGPDDFDLYCPDCRRTT